MLVYVIDIWVYLLSFHAHELLPLDTSRIVWHNVFKDGKENVCHRLGWKF
ncbi:hypothetical protein LINGRAHAP2_LOCUS10293 [Linum grandiflorum]